MDYKIDLLQDPKFLAKYPQFKNLKDRRSVMQRLFDGNSNITQVAPVPTSQTNNITINVNGGDPKQVTNSLQQYLRTNNGKLPTNGKKP